jgi:hypothetical protein
VTIKCVQKLTSLPFYTRGQWTVTFTQLLPNTYNLALSKSLTIQLLQTHIANVLDFDIREELEIFIVKVCELSHFQPPVVAHPQCRLVCVRWSNNELLLHKVVPSEQARINRVLSSRILQVCPLQFKTCQSSSIKCLSQKTNELSHRKTYILHLPTSESF